MSARTLAALAASLILIFAFTGCRPTADGPTITPDLTASPSLIDVDKAAEFSVAEETLILNEEGNYQIPIPDSWLNNVSYEIEGTKTTIYHITQDENEIEINPALLLIDIVPEGGEANGEVFMDIAGLEFYYIPRFDMPYSEGSADAIEFSAMYEDVPTVLQSFWLIDDSAWQNEINPLVDFRTFSVKDTYFGDIYIGEAKEDVLLKVRQPDSTEEIEWAATGETRDINQFPFGQLVFVDGTLVVAQITDTTYVGPRGITVGMSLDDVIAMFISGTEYSDDQMTIFYRQNAGGDTAFIVPPCAVLYKSGDTQTLAFSVFTENSGADEMTLEELSGGEYMFMEQYDLVCEFDADGVMTSYAVRVGTPSE